MADMMTFPDTVEEFMEQYKIVDTDQVYTNGVEMVPIFRMKQWFEHLTVVRTQMSSAELISRKAAIEAIEDHIKAYTSEMDGYNMARRHMRELIEVLPSAQPEIIHCKGCMHSEEDEDEYGSIDRWCSIWAETCEDDGFCNYAERRTDG